MQREEGLNNDLFDFLAREKSIHVYSVSEITDRIRGKLEEGFPRVWVAGELSNVTRAPSGHVYLTLKDEGAQMSAVVWRSDAVKIRFELRDGLAVIVQGEITVYPPRGQYQLICRQVHPRGLGALELAFRQMTERLQKEGLFAPERKRPLPAFPRRVGIVTSPAGAVIRDILKVLETRCPSAAVLLCPVRVQGQGAAKEIADAIALMNTVPDVDVLIVGRGGGSIEDLWAFNEEPVARAIYASRIPVVSAVGHETDFTIADFVADVRALTPTDAAQRVVPDSGQLVQRLDSLRAGLSQGLRARVRSARESFSSVTESYAFRNPRELVRRLERALDDDCGRLARTGKLLLPERRRALDALAAGLRSLSPRNVLARGYSITILEKNGKIVKSVSDVATGDRLTSLLQDGALHSTADSTSPGEEDGGKRS